MQILFVYGTLLSDRVRRKILGRDVDVTKDCVEGLKISRVEESGEMYPNVVEDFGSKIPGAVFEVSDRDLEKFDEYETNLYKRRPVKTQSGKNVMMYISYGQKI